ncbi:hypothetical protein [Chryseobacterium arthrosphaerae]|uniref:hypothetical protein n=1 Tax=Chryseobacterium arthrosphaerae TaxID=651561 RepID=UPI001E4AEB75|nr:hypothetical protein [Chryseobacterium arthrosphaerae]UEQ75464.1 hypothetical protein J8N07_17625 [Chryseobacterium arthrosphaerae]
MSGTSGGYLLGVNGYYLKDIIEQNNTFLSVQILLPPKRVAERLLLNVSLRAINFIRRIFILMKSETIEL